MGGLEDCFSFIIRDKKQKRAPKMTDFLLMGSHYFGLETGTLRGNCLHCCLSVKIQNSPSHNLTSESFLVRIAETCASKCERSGLCLIWNICRRTVGNPKHGFN